ncbi:DUF982 domain-containing protein [Mesorhizobium sp. B3-1-3]|uniref:DUF982 domain-containing protein n=1 Tax=unclassified Mesorhizobium TaxID=325217 RepID=UPI001129D026|nr:MULTISPECIES: DUF982 domain-containing protein [unclassified Mesorhizobium]TPI67606.1 DUF982 domain-containing protein [Mesorhizobium sp. B3-1-8]TPI75652.1 DUF982 domain-containing protein [Mesorhizobium sp. B3-1-3]
MSLHWFSPPVPIKVRVGLTLNVSNVEAAGAELLRFTKKGKHWRRAVECVVAFGEGQASVADVRRTFRLAAKEEGVLMPEEVS